MLKQGDFFKGVKDGDKQTTARFFEREVPINHLKRDDGYYEKPSSETKIIHSCEVVVSGDRGNRPVFTIKDNHAKSNELKDRFPDAWENFKAKLKPVENTVVEDDKKDENSEDELTEPTKTVIKRRKRRKKRVVKKEIKTEE